MSKDLFTEKAPPKKFRIVRIERRLLGTLRLHPLKVLVRFDDGVERWFNTWDFDHEGLFWYRLFENIQKFLGGNYAKILSTTYELEDQYSYQKYERIIQ
jgi:hypothetical protein